MRKWYKYILDAASKGVVYKPMDQTYSEHALSMGGYDIDDAYKSKAEFFKKYFFNYQQSRLEYYNVFLKKHLHKNEKILSIASGRCANELFLMEQGYDITCSDMEMLYSFNQTKALFGQFKFLKLDVLSGPINERYDAMMCLSLIYLFDEKKLNLFFYNIAESLNKNGHLILDSAGSPDNLLSYLILDILLKYETFLTRILKLLFQRKWYGFAVKDFGYRRTNSEIIKVAERNGFLLIDKQKYSFLTEFYRSRILSRIMNYCPVCKRILNAIGKKVPYIRMFYFQKIS